MVRALAPLVIVLVLIASLVAVLTGRLYFAQFVLLVFSGLFATALIKGFMRAE